MALLPPAQEHILQQENGKERFVQIVTELSQAFALCAGSEEALAIRDDIGFFRAVKAALAKPRGERKSSESLDHAVSQLVAKAIVPEGEIIDVFSAAGTKHRTSASSPIRSWRRFAAFRPNDRRGSCCISRVVSQSKSPCAVKRDTCRTSGVFG